MTEHEKAQQQLSNLKLAHQKFYLSKAGKAQLKWLDDFEANLMNKAMVGSETEVRIACLNQAKGLRTFRMYLESLMGD